MLRNGIVRKLWMFFDARTSIFSNHSSHLNKSILDVIDYRQETRIYEAYEPLWKDPQHD
jgi:hypothetical protein